MTQAKDDILELFKQDKLLVRAMETPTLQRSNDGTKSLEYDFTVWAEEVDASLNAELSSLSTTLLVAGEHIPTYKNCGFIINSEKAEIFHISDRDSGSSGDIRRGDFYANESNIHSLSELAEKTKKEKSLDMNEVNINIKNEALIGLFANESQSGVPLAQTLLAQKYYELHTGKKLPIYTYNISKGELTPLIMTDKEQKNFLRDMKQNGKIKSLTISYDLDTDFTKESKKISLTEDTLIPNNIAEKFANAYKKIEESRSNTLSPRPMAELRGISAPVKAPLKPRQTNIDINTLKLYQNSQQND